MENTNYKEKNQVINQEIDKLTKKSQFFFLRRNFLHIEKITLCVDTLDSHGFTQKAFAYFPQYPNRNFTSIFGDRSSFRAKGCDRIFGAVFGDRIKKGLWGAN
jgi:hypothetical protein